LGQRQSLGLSQPRRENHVVCLRAGWVTGEQNHQPIGSSPRACFTGVSVTTNYYGGEAEEKSGTYTRYPHPDVMVESTGGVNTIKFMHRDHLASVRLITKMDGTVQEGNRYAAYGEPKAVSSLSKGCFSAPPLSGKPLAGPPWRTRRPG
jgi:hypothetical protein